MKILIGIIYMLLFSILVSASFAASEEKVNLKVDLIDNIRNPNPGIYPGYLEITFLGDFNETIFLKDMIIDWGNSNTRVILLNETLTGIKNDYQMLNNIRARKKEYNLTALNISELRINVSKGIHRERIIVDPPKIFNEGFIPGKEKTIHFDLIYIFNNKSNILRQDFTMKVIPPFIKRPAKVDQTFSISSVPPDISSYYYGDLHVHTGYSSWLGGYDGNEQTFDNCGEEIYSSYGSTIPDLRDQAIFFGLDWLSITDHSYCLDTNEFNNIRYWSQGNSTSSFQIIPGEEASVDDIPDDGSDGEPLCNWPNDDNVAHLGGHNISSYISGGLCNDQPYNAQQGIDEVKQSGGIPIINHPYGGDFMNWGTDTWDWEANSNSSNETGVEIWNGNSSNNISINFWVSRLLRGNKTYAYAGSDTHDTASDNAVNGVYISGTFNITNLLDGLNKGHVFITNGPFLSLQNRTDSNIMMGDTAIVNLGDTVEFLINLTPLSQGILTIHKGVIGDNNEDTDPGWPLVYNISSAEEIVFSDTPDKNCSYRAHYEATNNSGFSAFTNPIWIEMKSIPGWKKGKLKTITGSTSGAQTNYQMKLTVYNTSGTDTPGNVYLNGSARSDFGDIRFTKPDGITLLDYWIESYTIGVSAVVWIEVDSIPASPGNASIYLYYGNPGASSAGNGDATFEFFDDFSGTGIDTGKWSVTGSAVVNNGYVRMTSNGSALTSLSNFGSADIVFVTRTSVSNNIKFFIGLADSTAAGPRNGSYYQIGWDRSGLWYDWELWTANNGVNSRLDMGSPAQASNVWQKIEVKRLLGSIAYYLNDAHKVTHTNVPAISMPFQISTNWSTTYLNSQPDDVDIVRVRKYVSSEPVWGS